MEDFITVKTEIDNEHYPKGTIKWSAMWKRVSMQRLCVGCPAGQGNSEKEAIEDLLKRTQIINLGV
jgi:hypothetical protein